MIRVGIKNPEGAGTPTGPVITLAHSKETNMNSIAKDVSNSQISADVGHELFDISRLASTGRSLALALSTDDVVESLHADDIANALDDLYRKFKEIESRLDQVQSW